MWCRPSQAAVCLVVLAAAACTPAGSEPPIDASSSRMEIRLSALDNENNIDILRLFDTDAARQELIATCMRAEGFEYEPEARPVLIVPDDVARDRFERAGRLDPLSTEYREEFGYGVSTLDALLHVVSNSGDGNLAFRDADEQDKFERTLYGDAFVDAGQAGTIAEDQVPDGCVGWATDQLPFTYTTPDEEYAAYHETIREVGLRVLADPAYVEAEARWVACASGRGYRFRERSDVIAYFEDELDAINVFLRDGGEVQVVDEGQIVSDALLQETGLSFGATRANSSIFDEQDLALVRQHEIEVALELQRCDAAFASATADAIDDVAAEILVAKGFQLP